MVLTLYKTLDGENVINKALTDATAINILLKRDVDLVNLDLRLKSESGIDYRQFNYLHISELNRYYFIRQIHSLSAELFKLVCECDYLETYKAAILASPAKYRRKIEAGDYGEFDPELTGREIITRHESDTTLIESTNTIFSTLRWY